MVPYLYLPYRIWQLFEGLTLLSPDNLIWVKNLLLAQIVLWTLNYALDLSDASQTSQVGGQFKSINKTKSRGKL